MEPALDYFDEAHFVLALEASPEDDISRLAYADWLEERGDERAAYLRAIAAMRQTLRERDATPEDWLPVHRAWKGQHDAWQQDVGGRFDVAVTKFGLEDLMGYLLGRARAVVLERRCRETGWELVRQGLPLDQAAKAGRALASAGSTIMLRASRLVYPFDYTRLAPCVANGPVGEMHTRSLPQGLLTTWTGITARPAAANRPQVDEARPAIFSGEQGSTVLSNVAALDLLARTSGYVPDERGLSVILPPEWHVLDKPAKPKWSDHGVAFHCRDAVRGWTLRCEYRPGGCVVSAVERSSKGR